MSLVFLQKLKTGEQSKKNPDQKVLVFTKTNSNGKETEVILQSPLQEKFSAHAKKIFVKTFYFKGSENVKLYWDSRFVVHFSRIINNNSNNYSFELYGFKPFSHPPSKLWIFYLDCYLSYPLLVQHNNNNNNGTIYYESSQTKLFSYNIYWAPQMPSLLSVHHSTLRQK
jgi:hypothetical protein